MDKFIKSKCLNRKHPSTKHQSDKEREKARAAVLKAFETRLKQSPGRGGALLMGKFTQENESEREEVRESIMMENCDMSGDNVEGNEGAVPSPHLSPRSPHKVKRRKTRAERNKLYAKTYHKTDKDNVINFNKHGQRAHDILNLKSESNQVCAITQNRLTRRLGLFNKGKKSETINREPVVVPESVQVKTNDDIRRILSHDDDDDTAMCTGNIVNLGKRFEKGDKSVIRNKKRHSSHGKMTPKSCSSISLPSSGSPMNKCVEIEPVMKEMPSSSNSPDIHAIALQLLPGVNIKEKFPGRRYLREVRDDLCRLLRQNAPENSSPSDETPMRQTPKTQLNSDTVKRKLTDSMPPPHLPPVSESMEIGDTTVSVPAVCEAHTSTQPPAIASMTAPATYPSQAAEDLPTCIDVDTLTDANVLFAFNEKAMAAKMSAGSEGSSQNCSSQDTMNMACQSSNTQDVKFQTHVPHCQLDLHTYMSHDRPHHHFMSHQQETQLNRVGHDHCYQGNHKMEMDLRTMFQPMPLEALHPHGDLVPNHIKQQECMQYTDKLKLNDILEQIHAKNVVTQYVYPSQYYKSMGNPADAMSLLHTCLAKQQDLQHPEAMDILDELDQELDDFPTHNYVDPLSSHNSEMLHSIPPWLRNIPASPKKPSIDDTPTPPDKLYPRRMY